MGYFKKGNAGACLEYGFGLQYNYIVIRNPKTHNFDYYLGPCMMPGDHPIEELRRCHGSDPEPLCFDEEGFSFGASEVWFLGKGSWGMGFRAPKPSTLRMKPKSS